MPPAGPTHAEPAGNHLVSLADTNAPTAKTMGYNRNQTQSRDTKARVCERTVTWKDKRMIDQLIPIRL